MGEAAVRDRFSFPDILAKADKCVSDLATAINSTSKVAAKSRQVLDNCDYNQAQALIDKLPQGPEKDELAQKLADGRALEDTLRSLVDEARTLYRECRFNKVMPILNEALAKAKCEKHKNSINKKIRLTKSRRQHEETTLALFEEANGLYKTGNYQDALTKLRQALEHTSCQRFRDSLGKKVAKVQGKIDSGETEGEEQVAALDCSRYGEAEAYWNESEKRARCKCKSGYKPSGNTCVPTRETLVQNLDCRAYPNTYAAWDRKNNRAACFCINKNYKWRSDGKGCIPKSGGVIQQDPMCPAAVYAIKNKLRSGDNTGLTLLANNAKSMGCTDPVIDQVLSGGTGGGGTSGGTGGGGNEQISPSCSRYYKEITSLAQQNKQLMMKISRIQGGSKRAEALRKQLACQIVSSSRKMSERVKAARNAGCPVTIPDPAAFGGAMSGFRQLCR